MCVVSSIIIVSDNCISLQFVLINVTVSQFYSLKFIFWGKIIAWIMDTPFHFQGARFNQKWINSFDKQFKKLLKKNARRLFHLLISSTVLYYIISLLLVRPVVKSHHYYSTK